MYRSSSRIGVFKSKRLRRVRHVTRIDEGTISLKTLTGKYMEERPLGRPSRRWENNIRIGIRRTSVNMRNSIDFSLYI